MSAMDDDEVVVVILFLSLFWVGDTNSGVVNLRTMRHDSTAQHGTAYRHRFFSGVKRRGCVALRCTASHLFPFHE
jgi:hypothetical protein